MIAGCGHGLSPGWGAGLGGGGGCKGAGGGSCVGQVLARFSLPLGRCGRHVCRAQLTSLRWPVSITSLGKTLTPRHGEVKILQLQTLPVHPSAGTVPPHRVAPWPPLPGPALKSAGSKGVLWSTFTKCFPLHSSLSNNHLFPAHKQNTLSSMRFCSLSGIFLGMEVDCDANALDFLGTLLLSGISVSDRPR